MNRFCFRLLLLAIGVLGTWLLRCQDALLIRTREESLRRSAIPTATSRSGPDNAVARRPASHPSIELLKLRAEVTRLRDELESDQASIRQVRRAADDWALVFGGTRPSGQPDFVHFSNIVAAGHATPAAAFAAFQYAFRHQTETPLTETRMKELFDVPDDYDDPAARYSIDLGPGFGGEFGYRIVRQERIDAERVRLVLEMENPDGSSFRQERVFVERDGRWRLQPAGLRRTHDPVP